MFAVAVPFASMFTRFTSITMLSPLVRTTPGAVVVGFTFILGSCLIVPDLVLNGENPEELPTTIE